MISNFNITCSLLPKLSHIQTYTFVYKTPVATPYSQCAVDRGILKGRFLILRLLPICNYILFARQFNLSCS